MKIRTLIEGIEEIKTGIINAIQNIIITLVDMIETTITEMIESIMTPAEAIITMIKKKSNQGANVKEVNLRIHPGAAPTQIKKKGD